MPSPDLILHNGRIYPKANPRIRFEALAIWNGRVTDLGSDLAILKLRAGNTKSMNLRGKVVLPGFCDSHIHLLNYGMLLRTIDLSKTGSIEELKRQVGRAGSLKSKNKWVLGRGWDDEKLRDHRYPDRRDLDEVSSNPVFLKRICGHVAVANTKALAIAGITKDTANPKGGIIVRDAEGQPNGVVKEHALELVEKVIPQSVDENRRAIALAARRLAKLGITYLHCIVGDARELVALRRAKQNNQIPQSIYALMPLDLMDQLASLGLTTEKDAGRFRIGGVKLFLDGSLGARTAALQAPYADDKSNEGMLTMEKEELDAIARKARDSGFQLCIHAIGDRAVALAIQTLEESFGARRCRDLRHRIEHASLTAPEHVSKMGKLGIIASVQPRFIFSDSWAQERLGSERKKHLYPFASFIRHKVVLTAGSDCPIENPNPFEGIWSATERPGLDSGEKLTVSQAIKAYTECPAYASFSEDIRGTLEPGKAADLVVLDRDPFECDSNSLRKTRVLETIIGGKVFS